MRYLSILKRFLIIAFLVVYAISSSAVCAAQEQVDNKKTTGDFWSLVKSDVKFKKISVGDVDEVWAVSNDDNVYQLTSDGWEKRIEGIDVGVAEDDTVIVVKKDNSVVSRDEEEDFEPIKDVKLTSVAVGGNDAIWGIHKEGDKIVVYHFDNGKWEKAKNAKGEDIKSIVHFSVNAEEVVYAVDDKGNVFCRDLDRLELLKKMAAIKSKKAKEKSRKRHKTAAPSTVLKTTTGTVTKETKSAKPKKSEKVTTSKAAKSTTVKGRSSKGALKIPTKKSKSVGMGKVVKKELKKHSLAKEE